MARLVQRPSTGGHTPSDFPLTALSQSQVDRLEAANPGLEDILPLSTLQEGLLFHALYDSAAPDVYTVQLVIELSGDLEYPPPPPVRLRSPPARHANLRIAIADAGLDRPVQVFARRHPPWLKVDLAGSAPQDQGLRDTTNCWRPIAANGSTSPPAPCSASPWSGCG